MENNHLPSNLKYLRKKKGLTQHQMGVLCRKSDKTISTYELGTREPSVEDIYFISNYFMVSADDLLTKDLRVLDQQQDQLAILFSKHRDILTKEDEEYIRFIIEKRKREIDKQQGVDYDNWYVRGKHNPTRIAKRI